MEEKFARANDPMSGVAMVRAAVPDDGGAIARVHVASWRTTYRGRLPASVPMHLSVEGREAQWLRQIEAIERGVAVGCVSVAEGGDGRVLGFASGGRSGCPAVRPFPSVPALRRVARMSNSPACRPVLPSASPPAQRSDRGRPAPEAHLTAESRSPASASPNQMLR